MFLFPQNKTIWLLGCFLFPFVFILSHWPGLFIIHFVLRDVGFFSFPLRSERQRAVSGLDGFFSCVLIFILRAVVVPSSTDSLFLILCLCGFLRFVISLSYSPTVPFHNSLNHTEHMVFIFPMFIHQLHSLIREN